MDEIREFESFASKCLNQRFLTNFWTHLENFPKPGTKADTRMLIEEENHIDESSSGDDDCENKDEKL